MNLLGTENGKTYMQLYQADNISIFNDDVLNLYSSWEPPVVIISDGPYGISGFPNDLSTAEELSDWYEPHIEKWSQKSTPKTTLWFWNTEIGWASVHPALKKSGWKFINCHIWDKGLAHIAGNSNTKTLRKFPVVTEVCVQYVKKPSFNLNGKNLSMREWLRYEWERTGIPFNKANEACGVKNAATRKYLTKCHLWYFPPVEAFVNLVNYANKHGDPSKRPYFSIDGKNSLTGSEWENFRSKFYCEHGITNVWATPPLNGRERIKNGSKSVHLNQKPLELMKRIIRASSDKNDLIWEPFGGLCSGALASKILERKCLAAEIDPYYYKLALRRFEDDKQSRIPGC